MTPIKVILISIINHIKSIVDEEEFIDGLKYNMWYLKDVSQKILIPSFISNGTGLDINSVRLQDNYMLSLVLENDELIVTNSGCLITFTYSLELSNPRFFDELYSLINNAGIVRLIVINQNLQESIGKILNELLTD